MRNGNAPEYLKKNRGADRLQIVSIALHLRIVLSFARTQCYEVAQGLHYMHSRDVVHGNLLPVSATFESISCFSVSLPGDVYYVEACILISEKGSAIISGFLFTHPSPAPSSRNTDVKSFDWTDIESFPAHTKYRRTTKGSDIRCLGALFSQACNNCVKCSLLVHLNFLYGNSFWAGNGSRDPDL